MSSKLRRGDKVVVISGSCKGEIGTIKWIKPKLNIALVDNVNKRLRHLKKSSTTEGGRVLNELPLYLSKLALLDAENNKSKVGFRFENGRKVRFFKKTGVTIDD